MEILRQAQPKHGCFWKHHWDPPAILQMLPLAGRRSDIWALSIPCATYRRDVQDRCWRWLACPVACRALPSHSSTQPFLQFLPNAQFVYQVSQRCSTSCLPCKAFGTTNCTSAQIFTYRRRWPGAMCAEMYWGFGSIPLLSCFSYVV